MFAASKTAAAAAGTPPPSTDPQFNYVTMLLHGDGTNGAQNNTFVDSSTNNFTITRNGTPTQGSFSPYGDLWSNYFSGSSQYLSFPANAAFDFGSGNFTVEAWVFISGNSALDGNSRRMANVFSVANSAYQFVFTIDGNSTTTGTGFSIYNGSAGISVTTTISQNTWNHVAVVRSGSSCYFFLNGVQVGTTQAISGNWGASTSGAQIGQSLPGSYTFPLNGYVSNARVVKGTALYTSNFTPSTTPLTAVSGTSLMTCQSNRFRDNSSNNFAITVTGTPSVQRFSPFDPAAEYSTSVIGGSGFAASSSEYLLSTGNVQFTGNFTVEAWVYITSATTKDVFKIGNEASGRLSFGVDSSMRLFSNAFGTSSILYGGASVSLNAWTHIAWVRNGTTVTGYANGVAQGTQTISGNVGNTGGFLVGQGPMYISNTRFVNGSAVYTATFTPPTTPLTAITNTSLLLNTVNAGIFDNAMMNDLVTVGNAQVSTAVKKYGTGSMAFDGSGDYLQTVPSALYDFGTGDFTIECWFYIAGNSALNNSSVRDACLFSLTSGTSVAGGFFILGNSTTTGTGLQLFKNTNTTTNVSATATIAQNVWHHAAAARSGSSVRLFLNGVQIGTTVSSATIWGSSTFIPYVGANQATGYLDHINGYIDDLRITKGIARYTANFTPPTAALPNN